MTNSALTPELIAFVQEAKDRHDIEQCLLRYCRGVDRHDPVLMASAYHADAWDEHGPMSCGPDAFAAWAIDFHQTHQIHHHHVITNSLIELDGDTAHAETYYLFVGKNRQGPPTIAYGRYIDRLEKRDGRWGIAHRVSLNELSGNFEESVMPPEFAALMDSTGPKARDKTDLSYRRPLTRA